MERKVSWLDSEVYEERVEERWRGDGEENGAVMLCYGYGDGNGHIGGQSNVRSPDSPHSTNT